MTLTITKFLGLIQFIQTKMTPLKCSIHQPYNPLREYKNSGTYLLNVSDAAKDKDRKIIDTFILDGQNVIRT